jgi:hypothetical protein
MKGKKTEIQLIANDRGWTFEEITKRWESLSGKCHELRLLVSSAT